MRTEKIGILTTIDHPLLPFFLNSFYKNHLEDLVFICDSKLKTKKSNSIWQERTGGVFKELYGKKIDDLESYFSNKFYFVDNHNSKIAHQVYKELEISCLFNAGTPRKISKETIDLISFGVVNIHPGILPKYRGACAVEWSIFNDDLVGLTAHLMNQDYDAGPIIDTRFIKLDEQDTYQDIRNKVFFETTVMAGITLKNIQQNSSKIKLISQNEQNAMYWDPMDDTTFSSIRQKVDSGEYFQKIKKTMP